ncbi:pyridoxal phosphate-dependent transferase [Xylaria flabelliformis]|nr:pyridoxal phosphate-dependent transferase [Xylaria flabelliformis]
MADIYIFTVYTRCSAVTLHLGLPLIDRSSLLVSQKTVPREKKRNNSRALDLHIQLVSISGELRQERSYSPDFCDYLTFPLTVVTVSISNHDGDRSTRAEALPYDVEGVQKHFPALRGDLIPLHNATGSLVYEGATKAIANALSTYQLDLIGGDTISQLQFDERKSKYAELAEFMNAEPDEIAFGPSTSGLTRNLTNSLRPFLNSDSEMIVSTLCHEAGRTSWVALARFLGIEIKWWSPRGVSGSNPKLSIETLEPLLSPRTKLVAYSHVSKIFGTIEDIRAVTDVVHAIPGALLSVDGVAWAPHRPIDVKAMDVDFYFFS